MRIAIDKNGANIVGLQSLNAILKFAGTGRIIHVLKRGLQWWDAPNEYGPHKTLYSRFIRWSRLGIFDRIFKELSSRDVPDELQIDATHLKAHRTASSLLKRGCSPRHRTHKRWIEFKASCGLSIANRGGRSHPRKKERTHDDANKRSVRRGLPDQVEIENADSLHRIIASQVNGDEAVKLSPALDGKQIEPVTLAPVLAASLMELLRLVSSGREFRVIPVDAELTTQQAADLLNVSRPHLVKLLENGDIAFFKTERHRRVKAADLFEYKTKRDTDRSDALSDLAAMDMESDLL